MKDNTFYTKLTYEHKYPEEYGPEVITCKKEAWDLDLYHLFEMFHGIALAAGYQEGSFKKVFIEWLAEYYDIYVPESTDECGDDAEYEVPSTCK